MAANFEVNFKNLDQLVGGQVINSAPWDVCQTLYRQRPLNRLVTRLRGISVSEVRILITKYEIRIHYCLHRHSTPKQILPFGLALLNPRSVFIHHNDRGAKAETEAEKEKENIFLAKNLASCMQHISGWAPTMVTIGGLPFTARQFDQLFRYAPSEIYIGDCSITPTPTFSELVPYFANANIFSVKIKDLKIKAEDVAAFLDATDGRTYDLFGLHNLDPSLDIEAVCALYRPHFRCSKTVISFYRDNNSFASENLRKKSEEVQERIPRIFIV